MFEHLRTRTIKESDIPVLLNMTRAEGWFFSEADCRASLSVDPQGMRVAEDEFGNQLGFIGHSDMVADMVYVNNFITRADIRGRGVGKRLWEEMLRKCAGKNLVLDAVIEMVPWYKKQGFVFEEYEEHVYRGTVMRNEEKVVAENFSIHTLTIQTITDDVWSQLLEYDKQTHKIVREKILRALFDSKWSITVVAMDEYRLVGYANFNGTMDLVYHIRGLYADNREIAECLLENLLNKMTVGASVALLLLDGKQLPKCVAGFEYVFSKRRMMTNRTEPINTDKMYTQQK